MNESAGVRVPSKMASEMASRSMAIEMAWRPRGSAYRWSYVGNPM